MTGTPPPLVEWFKDKQIISGDKERTTIKADGTRHGIVLSKVTVDDSGLYTVRASNRAGEANSSAELLVSPALTAATETEMILQQKMVVERVAVKHPSLKLNIAARAVVESDPEALVPEPPPQVAYAKKLDTAGTKQRDDFVEKTRILEEASKMVSPTEVPGGIRLLPLPSEDSPKIPAAQFNPDFNSADASLVSTTLTSTSTLVDSATVLTKFERFPELEPFPFRPDPPQPKTEKSAPPRKPRRFVKGDSKESDYESDLETRIPARWMPPGSDTEESSYKKVKPKLRTDRADRSCSREATNREPTPPSLFDQVHNNPVKNH